MFILFFRGVKHYSDHLFVFFMLFYIFFSVHLVSLFEISSIGFMKDYITEQEYRQLATWGNRLFFIILAIVSIYGQRGGSHQKQLSYQITTVQTEYGRIDKQMTSYLIFVYFLQFISVALGITDSLENSSVQLPFHLNGIFDELRTSVCQFAFCIYLYNKFKHKGKIKKNVVVMYIIYAVLEVFVKNSKGALVFSFLPLMVMMFMMQRINKKTVIKYVLPLVIVFVVSYPIIETARQYGQLSLSSLQEASKEVGKSNDEENSSSYVRAFLTGVYYTKLLDEVNPNQAEFDFTRVPMLVLLGGGASYMTRVIDQFPTDVHHSSGITGLCDALLWGGYPLCYIVVAILTVLAIVGDRSKLFRSKPLYRLIFFFWFYSRFVANTVSFFIDPLLLSALGSIIIRIILTSLYYKMYEQPAKAVRVLSYN